MLAFGTSYKVTDDITFSAAYTHQFRNTMSGPILQTPGSSVKEDVQIDSIIVGMNVRFGGVRKSGARPAPAPVMQASAAPVIQASAAPDDPEILPASGTPESAAPREVAGEASLREAAPAAR